MEANTAISQSDLLPRNLHSVLNKVVNLALFNVLWISFVVGRYEWVWLSLPVLVVYIGFLLLRQIVKPMQIVLPAAIGITADSLFSLLGLFTFPTADSAWYVAQPGLLPFWFILLWVAFATTLSQSLRFLADKVLLTVLAGAVAFPFNYWVGSQLGGIYFPHGKLITFAVIGVSWAILLPLAFKSLRLNAGQANDNS